MDPERWQRVDTVLDRVLSADRSSWPTILDDSCGTDRELRAEVEALLARLPQAAEFLASPPSATASALIAHAMEESAAMTLEGRRIGAYLIVRQIGRGGMSRVYLAERADGEFQQRVAFKVLRPGLDSDRDVERLRTERRILAALNHPNIARLFDGGVIDDARPYLVMEYVDGEPIDRYCAERRLGVADRLRLFLAIADAVQYAHRSLVVHRDLKPSNIFVASDGTVKLLDFGLAKLLLGSDDSSGNASLTQPGRAWMTPAYAAPEQVLGDPTTTQTDIYQLGAVLYELLTSRLPFADHTQSLRQLEDAVLRTTPQAPSAANPSVRGDIDAIVLKALRKEPDQRYETVQAFADDVRRWLSGRPVMARPQSVPYRVRRFVGRNRLVTAGGVAIVMLVVAYVTTVVRERERVQRALAEAREGTRKAEQVTGFMMGLFEASEGGKALTDTVTARGLLDRGLVEARQMAAQPALQAQMLDVIGRLHLELGDLDRARPLVEEGLAIRRRVYGPSHPEVATSLENLATVVERRQDVAETVRLRREALALRRSVSGDGDPRTSDATLDLAFALHQSGDVAAANVLFDEWLALVAKQPGEASASRATRLTSLADLLALRGETARAVATHRQALDMRRRVFGDRHFLVASSLIDVALLLDARSGREADSLCLRAVELLRSTYPEGHPLLANALRTRGIVLARSDRFADAQAPLREALELRRKLLGPNAVDVARTALDLAYVVTMSGGYDEALTLSREAERVYREALGDRSGMVAVAQKHVGDALRGQGKYAEAERLLLAVLERFSPPRAITRNWRNGTLDALARLADAQGKPDEAARYRGMRESTAAR